MPRSNDEKNIPPVSVMVIAYNAKNTIRQCLSAIFNVDYPRDKFEVIVVDGGSNDGTLDILKEFPIDKLVVTEHKGRGHARNIGIREARYEIVATIDADEVVTRNWIRSFINYFRDPKVGLVYSGVKVPSPNKNVSRFEKINYLFYAYYSRSMSHGQQNL